MVMEPVSIHSIRRDIALIFSDLRKEGDVYYITAELTGRDAQHVSAKVEQAGIQRLARFFANLAANRKGWDDEKRWESEPRDVILIATVERLGHIELTVTIRPGTRADAPSLTTTINLESGQLTEIDNDMRDFLGIPRTPPPAA